jgi:hypothetical protein
MSAGTGWPVGGPGDRSDRAHTVWRVLFLALLLGVLAGTVAARDDAAVQELTGRIEPGRADRSRRRGPEYLRFEDACRCPGGDGKPLR